MLSVCTLTYTTKSMTFNDSLKTLPFRSTDDVYICCVIQEIHCEYIAKLILSVEIFELSQVSLWSYTRFLKMASFRLCRMLFFLLLKAQLNCLVAVILYGFYLRNYTRTYFDNSTWKILSLGTENGCHSDFFS